MTHPVLAANEAYSRWAEEGEELVRRRASLAEQIVTVNAADAKARAKHEQAVAEAVATSQPIPKPPRLAERSHLDAAIRLQEQAEQQHRARRTEVLAEAAETGALQGLDDRERGCMARVAEVLPLLIDALDERRADAQIRRDLIRAVDLRAGLAVRPPRADRILMPDMLAMLNAAASGRSLLEPSPVDPSMRPGVGMRVERVGPDDEAARVPPWRGNGPDTWPRVDMRSNRGVQI